MAIFSLTNNNLRTNEDLCLATTFQIKELTGDKRALLLAGRALPYRPLTFSGTMRADVTYYPGNPEPTVQMLGASEEETTITGMWKDRFLGDGQQHAVLVFDEVGVIREVISALGGSPLGRTVLITAAEVVKVVDDIRRKGQLVRVSWDEFVREGFITKFEQTWDRRQDVAWSITFRFLNQGDRPPAAKTGPLSASPLQFSSMLQSNVELAAGFLGQSVFDRAIVRIRNATTFLQNKRNLLKDFANQATALVNPGALFISVSKEFISELAGLVVDSRNLLGKGLDGVIGKVDFATSVLSQMNNVLDKTNRYRVKIRSNPVEAYLRMTPQTDKTSLLGKVLSLSASLRGASRQLARLSGNTADSRAVVRTDMQSTKGSTGPSVPFIARQGDDLRKVARMIFGNANAWRVIAKYNNLSSSELEVGQRVYIPPQSYVQNAGLGRGSA